MRLGLGLGFEDSIATILSVAQQAEAAGFDSLQMFEAGRSASVTAAAVIGVTENIRVGTFVVNAYARDPWLTGIIARDLNELSGGRFELGVGTGNVHFNQWYMGQDSSRPIRKLRDYLRIVREVAAGAKGQAVRHEGEVHQIRWRASWAPTDPIPAVYLSASGPNMIRLAGEAADGVAVGIMSSVSFMNDFVRPHAVAGAAAVGKAPSTLRFPMGALVSVNEDAEVARRATQKTICGLFHPVPHPYYESQLRELGHSDFVDRAATLMPEGRTNDAMALVPDEVIDTMTITGTPQECARRVSDYEGAADEIIAMRVAQPGEPRGGAFEPLFELASVVRAQRAQVTNPVAAD